MGTTGLIPLESAGAAWRPSALNSVEHVTARIRNGVEILASLAGMPQVAAVQVHGNPQPYIYGLHPEYNIVVTQAFNELDSKRETTVCIDPLAQFLLFQDGYHARDTWENRMYAGRYLLNVLILMDAEIVAKRLRPGVDAMIWRYRCDLSKFKFTPELKATSDQITAEIKRINDENEAISQGYGAAPSGN